MSFFKLFLIAAGVSMDAFAVAICKGLSMSKMRWQDTLIIGIYFGVFQAGMPFFGYLLGVQFQDAIISIDHWIAFILLGVMGINMIREALSEDEETCCAQVDFGNMLLLALATSVDALAVGVTFAFLRIQIIPAITLIGITAFVLSIAGVKIGNVFGTRYKSKAEFAGGCILLLMGINILVEHL